MFKLNQAKYDLGAYAAFPFKCFSNSVENSRAFLFFVFDVVLASLVTLIRVAKLAIVSVPTFVAFSIWAYIGYNSYILDVLSWLRWNMYASERAVIFETGLKHYTTGCEFLAIICDYSVLFCATSTLYEAAFVTTSLANRLSSCLCLLLCVMSEAEITSFDLLDAHPTMVETLGTQELYNDACDAHHAYFYSSTPYGDIAERNRYKSRNIPCSVRARTKWGTNDIIREDIVYEV